VRDDPRRFERRLALLDALGHPERGLNVVQVAGTNGKGSVAAMVAAGLSAAGRRAGLFTSPDLGGPTERFQVDGHTIDPRRFAELESHVGPVVTHIEGQFPELGPLGAFERWCAMAWVWLANEKVELAIVEAGIGARYDATNVFERPLLSLVASIGFDHSDRLGTDLASIVHEKAGILRVGVPALTSAKGEALGILRLEAARLGVNLVVTAPLEGEMREAGGWNAFLPPLATTDQHTTASPVPATLALAGRFQLENAGLAVGALRALNESGWKVPDEAIARGLAAVAWPGRMEWVADPAGGDWLLDGAHNPPAVAALVESWGAPDVVVAGIQTSKDAAGMVPSLTAGGRPLVVLAVPGAVSSWDVDELASWAAGRVYPATDVGAALRLARALAPRGRRCVTGSLYLVGAARACLSQGAN
jgi:dihydrofolate synthase/folylpolyglutamate synthase